MKFIKTWFLTHKYCLVLLYFIPYLISYTALGRLRTPVWEVHCHLDDLIPFNVFFVIPYCLWFLYVGCTLVYLLFNSRREFLQFCSFLFTGTTICLLIFLIFPSTVAFRPEIEADGILSGLTAFIFAADCPTNVFPSIHVYGSLVTHIAIVRSQCMFRTWSPLAKKGIYALSLLLTISICLSTVFLKQHSVLDGLAAAVLCIPIYLLVYQFSLSASKARG